MNNLLMGIQFSKEDKIHQHMQVSLLPGRRRKENLACRFHSFFAAFLKEAFCVNSPISRGRNGKLRSGKLLNILGHIGNETSKLLVSFL